MSKSCQKWRLPVAFSGLAFLSRLTSNNSFSFKISRGFTAKESGSLPFLFLLENRQRVMFPHRYEEQ